MSAKKPTAAAAKGKKNRKAKAGPAPATPPPAPNASPLTGTKLSALSAAARVLAETGQAMNCRELIATMAAQGLWTSPGGRTPEATLASAMAREIRAKGVQARFRKVDGGQFAAKTPVTELVSAATASVFPGVAVRRLPHVRDIPWFSPARTWHGGAA
jgi:hypothetical protein